MSDPEKFTIDKVALAFGLIAIALVNLGLFLQAKTEVGIARTAVIVLIGVICALIAFVRLRRTGQ